MNPFQFIRSLHRRNTGRSPHPPRNPRLQLPKEHRKPTALRLSYYIVKYPTNVGIIF